MERRVRVFVELAGNLDVSDWAKKNDQGTAPDRTPYGLHRMASDDVEVSFRPKMRSKTAQRLARIVSGRSEGLELVQSMVSVADRGRSRADVIVAMDERAGLPAVWAPPRRPVVSGLAWLEDPAELDPAYRRFVEMSVPRLAGVFTLCPAMVGPLVEDFGIRRKRLHVIPFGIDVAHFRLQPWPREPGTVFSVGDDRMRDHQTLVRSISLLQAQGVKADLSLATLLPVSVPEAVGVVHRRRMDSAVREQYARASVVAVALKPTRQGSGLSVVLEGMASGRPVVVTANPGMDMYVEHGVTGFLVPAGDADAMADAIRRLLDDPEMACGMGMAGRARVEQNFTSTHMAAALRDVVRCVSSEPVKRR